MAEVGECMGSHKKWSILGAKLWFLADNDRIHMAAHTI